MQRIKCIINVDNLESHLNHSILKPATDVNICVAGSYNAIIIIPCKYEDRYLRQCPHMTPFHNHRSEAKEV